MNAYDPIEPQNIFHGIRMRPVVRGFIWDNCLSFVSGLLLAHYLLPDGLIASTESEADIVFVSAKFNLLFLPIGLSCTAFGAYIAAARCPGNELSNAIAVGVASLALGLSSLLIPIPGGEVPLWINLLGFVLLVPAAAAGGSIASGLRGGAA